jgi:hypothetical protein
MPAVTVLEDEYASLWYHPEKRIVHHKIHKYLAPGVFQKLLNAGAEQIEKNGAQKFLSDDRANTVVDPQDIKWADDHWYPRVTRAGLKHWALVLPKTTVGTLQLERIVRDRRKRGLDVEAFDNVEAAMAWLDSK